MCLVSLLQRQVESRAEQICKHRNQSMPAELGKASYESRHNEVTFIKQHFLLDSSHCDYMNPVAKVCWSDELTLWQLFLPHHSEPEQWLPYPYLAQSSDLTAIMREIEKDPKAIFWVD